MDLASLVKAEVAKKKLELDKNRVEAQNRSAMSATPQSTTVDFTTPSKNSRSKDSPIEKVDNSGSIEQDKLLERIKTRPERIRLIRERESKIDTKIQITSIGVASECSELSIKCNLYIHSLLQMWVEEGYKPHLILETKQALFPLLLKLRRAELPMDLLTSLASILYHVQQSEYIQATESYMRLSIGNVAWPIGVTSVGIHARSAHERIQGNDKIANVMMDEPTRLWITSTKRLITFKEALDRRTKVHDPDS